MDKRNNSIDIVKGLGMFLVIWSLSGFIVSILTLIISVGINEKIKIAFPFIYGLDKKAIS